MARRKSITPDRPFPSDLDRNRFGSWLSGFVDGEGSFTLHIKDVLTNKNRYPCAHARFSIGLREDDIEVMILIQAYLDCGSIQRKPDCHAGNPQLRFEVKNTPDLINVVIPHFERFPLMAKKRRDFAIWKEGVQFLRLVSTKKRHVHDRRGSARTWHEYEIAHFTEIKKRLWEVRQYQSPDFSAGCLTPLALPVTPRLREDPHPKLPGLDIDPA